MSPQSALKCPHCAGNEKDNLGLCPKHFNKLQKLWYKKLDDSGFSDIEQPESFKSGAPDGNLKQWSSSFFSSPTRFNAELFRAKEDYYRLAGQFLHEYNFLNDTHSKIWELHSQGLTSDSILSVLKGLKIKTVLGRKLNHVNIRRVLKLLNKEMIGTLAK